MNREEIILSGLLELYAMGLTSAEENILVEASLGQYPELKTELDAIELSLETYARAHAQVPSPSIREQVLSKIAGQKADSASTNLSENGKLPQKEPVGFMYRIPPLFTYAAAALLLLLLGSLVLNYQYYYRYHNTRTQLQVAQQEIEQNRQANLAMKNELNVMSDKNALPIVLNGTPQAPDALAKIYWMKNTGEIYVDPTNLPAAPQGKQYQFWAIIDGKPVDGGMISTSKGIYHIQKMKSFGHAEAFAITLEKTGGNPTPEGATFVIAKI